MKAHKIHSECKINSFELMHALIDADQRDDDEMMSSK